MSPDATPRDGCVVVVALCGGAALDGCLGRLRGEVGRCLVVLRDDQTGWQAAPHPGVEVVAGGRRPVPERRLLGLQAADSELVGLLEDTSWPQPGWWAAARAALADPTVALVGGPVTISTYLPSRLQALGWSEYGVFAPPEHTDAAPQPAARVPGNNFALRRSAVIDSLRGCSRGLVEESLRARLVGRGWRTLHAPGMGALYAGEDWQGARLVSRFHHGRGYGGQLAAGRCWPARLAFAARASVLPVLLWWRAMSAARRARVRLPAVAGWSALLAAAWSAGEVAGYLGGAGRSPERWQ